MHITNSRSLRQYYLDQVQGSNLSPDEHPLGFFIAISQAIESMSTKKENTYKCTNTKHAYSVEARLRLQAHDTDHILKSYELGDIRDKLTFYS